MRKKNITLPEQFKYSIEKLQKKREVNLGLIAALIKVKYSNMLLVYKSLHQYRYIFDVFHSQMLTSRVMLNQTWQMSLCIQ